MKSIRRQTFIGMTLVVTTALIAFSLVTQANIGSTLRSVFDDGLFAKARAIAALAEEDEDGLEFDPPDDALPEFALPERGEYYQIRRPDGATLARSPSLGGGDLERIEVASARAEFRDLTLPNGRPGRMIAMRAAPRREFSRSAPGGAIELTVQVALPADSVTTAIARVRRSQLVLCSAAVLVWIGVSAWVGRRQTRAIRRLSDEIASARDDALTRRVDAQYVPEELLPVARRLNELLERVEAALARERRFTGDVAHELRTPVAGLRARLELALSRDRTGGEYRDALRDCLSINVRMQRLVENLLELARADAGQLESRREPVEWSGFVRDLWRPFETRAAARQLDVEWRLATTPLIETDPDKLRLAVLNVFDNVISHADERGRVTVTTLSQNGSAELIVENSRRDASDEHIRRAFERFWRSPAADNGTAAHYGLGLPLCKAVVEHLGGTIEAACPHDGVFRVHIRLHNPPARQ